MFGQQLGRLEVDTPWAPPFASAMDVGHLRPLADSTGFAIDPQANAFIFGGL